LHWALARQLEILALKRQYLSRSGRIEFGLKPILKTGPLPGAKAPGYWSIRLMEENDGRLRLISPPLTLFLLNDP